MWGRSQGSDTKSAGGVSYANGADHTNATKVAEGSNAQDAGVVDDTKVAVALAIGARYADSSIGADGTGGAECMVWRQGMQVLWTAWYAGV